MSVISVIENILKDVATGIEIFEGIEPTVYQLLPASAQGVATTVTDDLTEILAGITDASAVLAAISGTNTATPQIALAATPKIKAILAKSEVQAGKVITDQAAYNVAVQQISQGFVNYLSAIGKKT